MSPASPSFATTVKISVSIATISGTLASYAGGEKTGISSFLSVTVIVIGIEAVCNGSATSVTLSCVEKYLSVI